MGRENVELHKALVEAFNARDLEAFSAYCDPEVEFHSTISVADGAVYHGHDGLRDWHRDLEEAWSEIHARPQAYFDLDEQTLTFNLWEGRGKQSGVEVAMQAAQVAQWRNGLVVYFKGYANREDALADLRISEDALEQIDP